MAARPLTDAEWDAISPRFPNLDRNSTLWQALPTAAYNCIAWSLGISWTWINPPPTLAAFTNMFNALGWQECAPQAGTIDGYALNGVMTHGACLLSGTTWNSKLGANFRISHFRTGLIGGPLYGNIIVSYNLAQPALAARMKEPLSRETLEQITTLDASLRLSYPDVTSQFDTLYAAWKATWFATPVLLLNQSSSDRATGSEWDALISLGTSVLPQVIAVLSQPGNEFATDLYNALETDPSRKVSPTAYVNYYFLTLQSSDDIALYTGTINTFNTTANQWTQDQQRVALSSHSQEYLDHGSFKSLVQQGQAIVPMVMDRYAKDQNGWWHELLYQILNGRPSDLQTFTKALLYKQWKDWFQGDKRLH